jgi:N-acetyl sugar amidotransferase
MEKDIMNDLDNVVCTRCVMDSSDPLIEFDLDGFCNNCKEAINKLQSKPYSLNEEEKEVEFEKLIKKIKADGVGKKYDCLIGLSGGVDSTYVAYILRKKGLRCLAIHLDNGWNSELSVMNIENICKKLNIDLFTKVLNWSEFKSLQIAFLKSSTPDSEVPTDHAIFASLFENAISFNIKYILTGSNLSSESILPIMWSYGHWDWKYIKGINNRFGSMRLKDFPHFNVLKLVFILVIKRIKIISTLNYVNYNKEEAKKIIMKELDWRDYGSKHHESIYTKFFQTYILPRKFGIDKRKAHFSSLICSGQLTRVDALSSLKISQLISNEVENDKTYVEKKLDLSPEAFDEIMSTETKTFKDYPNNLRLISKFQNIKKYLENVKSFIFPS